MILKTVYAAVVLMLCFFLATRKDGSHRFAPASRRSPE